MDPKSGQIQQSDDVVVSKCNTKRWLVILPLFVLLQVGVYFATDTPSATQCAMQQWRFFSADSTCSINNTTIPSGALNLTDPQFNFLYAAAALPNAVLMVVVGILTSMFGARLAVVVGVIGALVGQILVSVGVMDSSLPVMLVGRAVLGVAAESTSTGFAVLNIKYFASLKSMITGVVTFVGRGTSVASLNLGYLVAQLWGLAMAYWLAAVICALSVIAGFVLVFVDYRHDVANDLQTERDALPSLRETAASIAELPVTFWLITLSLSSFYPGMFTLTANGGVILMHKFRFTPDEANGIKSLIFGLALLTPFVGVLIDKCGYNVVFTLMGCVLAVVGTVFLLFTSNALWIGWFSFALVGVGYAFFVTATWPTLAFLVPLKRKQGAASGVQLAVWNAFCGATPFLMGQLLHTDHTATTMGYAVLGLLGFATLMAVLVLVVDRSSAEPMMWRRNAWTNEQMEALALLRRTVDEKSMLIPYEGAEDVTRMHSE
eukprot:TRINITY_DN8602_c0_g1_i1.p1 TRINITY_DN8602_c0_g1~~TRINITY_DN8602_c0_g1_i1.p1  ORF type:complete len:490 (-),score=104.01 TRINITY_DN8602_c0_g1_i1:214-1683(-)